MEPVGRLLILPAYDMCRIYGENKSLTGPISGKVFVTSSVVPEAQDFLYAAVKKSLSRISTLQIMAVDREAGEAGIGIEPISAPRGERVAAIQKLGRRYDAEGVFCIYLYAFRERVGQSYSVDLPARVSFELNLVSVATGRIVWQSHFTETQATLNENILKIGQFLKRKGRWITAKEMAEEAVEESMKALENDYLKPPH